MGGGGLLRNAVVVAGVCVVARRGSVRSARLTGSGNVLACPPRRARHFRTEKYFCTYLM